MNKFYNEVYDQDFLGGDTYGSIQWKGTDVCIDLYCKCGYEGHMDIDFLYYYECPKCNKKYALGRNIKLIELNKEQIEYVKNEELGFKTCELEEED